VSLSKYHRPDAPVPRKNTRLLTKLAIGGLRRLPASGLLFLSTPVAIAHQTTPREIASTVSILGINELPLRVLVISYRGLAFRSQKCHRPCMAHPMYMYIHQYVPGDGGVGAAWASYSFPSGPGATI
jgi:hypothetical protein